MKKYILAIESSCDETAASVILNDNQVLSNVVSSQIDVHSKFGGVMPEIASRLHVEQITVVIKQALEEAKVTMDDISAIAVTNGPGLIGALHVGLQAAKTLALAFNKPLIPVHHLAGHIYANSLVDKIQYPALAVVVSGGHTELVLMEEELKFKIIGRTQDDAIGECYDKVGRVIGVAYPGGAKIDKLFYEGKPSYKLPTPHTDEELNMSFSGLKTAVLNLAHKITQNGEEVNKADMACSFQTVAINMLVDKIGLALNKYNVKQVMIAGGVAANSYLRTKIKELIDSKENIQLLIPPMWSCGDNAAMIGLVGSILYDRQIFADLSVGVDPNLSLEN